MSPTTRRTLRLALASLIATALVAQLAIGLSRSGLTVVNFFSLFTVLSNGAAVVMLTMLASRPGRDDSSGFAAFRGAVTVYMSVTGLVYAFILTTSATDVGLTEPWVDWVLHIVGPLAVVADWFVHRPAAAVGRRSVFYWLAFPVAYLVYTLVRGQIVDWYPYPILDPDEVDGYGTVALWSGGVIVVIAIVGLFYQWWADRQRAETVPA